jgi:hypothetical protein
MRLPTRLLPRVSASALLACLTLGSTVVLAQPPGFQPPVQRSPREAAMVDVTGYWVALVTEDWLWRMVTPPVGDVTSVPLNPAGRQAANSWDLERDNANGDQCKAFGAAGLMRQPLRLHITWEDDDTLRIDTDIGQQTRLLHFAPDASATAEPSLQGQSQAGWTRSVGGFDMRAFFGDPKDTPQGPIKASLKVVTDNLLPGYLRKNGVPYSAGTELTEYFSTIATSDNQYLTLLSIVRDPMYLTGDFVTSSQFRKEADDANWNPSPCHTAPPAPAAAPEGAE